MVFNGAPPADGPLRDNLSSSREPVPHHLVIRTPTETPPSPLRHRQIPDPEPEPRTRRPS